MTTNCWPHINMQKKADRLQSELQAACNALESMTIEDDECFGEDFLSSLREFSQEMARKNNARKKVESLKTLLTNRGIIMHPTNINIRCRVIETPTWFSINGNEQSSAHMTSSPVMYETSGTSIRLEQSDHINTHKGVSYDNPKLCPDKEAKDSGDDHEKLAEESWHPSIKSVNYVETNEKCIKGEVAQVNS